MVDKDQGNSEANQANQAEEVLAGGHAVERDQDHSKANQASRAEEVSAGGRAADGGFATDQSEGQEAGARGSLDQKTGEGQETGTCGGFAKDHRGDQVANGEQGGPEATDEQGDLGVIVNFSCVTMAQEANGEQRGQGAKGVPGDVSKGTERRAGALRWTSRPRRREGWGEDTRGRGPKEAG